MKQGKHFAKMIKRFLRGITLLMVALFTLNGYAAQRDITISTIEELIEYAAKDDVNVTMNRGVYKIDDKSLFQTVTLKRYGSSTSVPNSKPTHSDFIVNSLLCFSGNNSTYNLDGVVVKLSSKIHTTITKGSVYKLLVVGNNNIIKGLSIEDESSDVAPKTNAIMATIVGDDNTFEGVNLLVKGSTYGYGHLLGKGVGNIVAIHKQSSLLVAGVNTKLLNCHVITRAYGHGIVMQGAVNTLIEGCYVEGEMRSTDDMLSETSGIAFDSGFKSIYPPGVFEPNRMIALSEDGVRTYPYGALVGRRTEGVTVVNTTIKNMRSGVDLSVHIPPTIIRGCTTIGCQEKGYSIGSQGVILDSRGDAQYGALLTFQRTDVRNCYIELELIPTEGSYKVTRLAEINGSGHYIKFTNRGDEGRKTPLPIVFGESFWADVHLFRQPDSEYSKFAMAKGVTLINETGMPTRFTKQSEGCRLFTNGEVSEDLGSNNSVCDISQHATVYNRGVAGNTTSNLLARLDRDVVALNPDLTIVMVGTNDMLNSKRVISYDKYRENLASIIQRIKGCGSEVMLMSSLPADSKYLFARHDSTKYWGHPDEVMVKVCDIVKGLAAEYSCHFVDLHGEFVGRGLPTHNEDIYIRNQKNSRVKDGVHPTAAGYKLMGEILCNYFTQHKLQTRYQTIVCLGDSITKGSGASGAGTVEGENYPSYFNRYLNKK